MTIMRSGLYNAHFGGEVSKKKRARWTLIYAFAFENVLLNLNRT